MKTIRFIFALVCLAASPLFAGPEEDVTKSAQSFYDGYMKVLAAKKDATAWIQKSDKVTPTFKKSYSARMKSPGSDPILCAQDYPDAGFRVSKANVGGDTAAVTLTSKNPLYAHTFKAVFVQKDGSWLLTGTDEIKPK